MIGFRAKTTLQGAEINIIPSTTIGVVSWPLFVPVSNDHARPKPAGLGLAWSFETGTNRGHETTPIVVDGMMFISAPWSVVFALNPITGEKIWSFDPQADKAWARNACCDVVNRGVAVWEDQVIIATIDGRLISLNKNSGEVNWDVLTIDKSKPYTITGAPRIIDGKIIIGNGGGEYGVRGYISAYDVQDGSMLWRFFNSFFISGAHRIFGCMQQCCF